MGLGSDISASLFAFWLPKIWNLQVDEYFGELNDEVLGALIELMTKQSSPKHVQT